MSGLGLFLEEAGITTVSISLVREHTEKMRPPRALWVPFPLGRPFGAAHDTAFQKRVIMSALKLLERDSGPVLEDFTEAMPTVADIDEAPWVCPVSFASRPVASPAQAIVEEIQALEPWYTLAVEQRRRTTVGLTGLDVKACAELLAAATDGEWPPVPQSIPSLPDALRWASEDLKAWYFEAASAQSRTAAQKDLEHWFWTETRAGGLLCDLRQVCLESSDPGIHDVGDFMLVADAYAE